MNSEANNFLSYVQPYCQVIALNYMDKKSPSEVNFSKDEIKEIISGLKKQDWITLPKNRAGRDGGAGNYIEEDVFGVKENNEERPDLGTYELKTHREHSDSLNTLKSIEPGIRDRMGLITPLVKNFGFPYGPQCNKRSKGKECMHKHYDPNDRCYPDGELSLNGVDMCGENSESKPNPRGFYIRNNKKEKRIEMHFDSDRIKMESSSIPEWVETLIERHGSIDELDLDSNFYWPYERVKERLIKKLAKMVWIKYQENEDKTKFKVTDAYFYEDFDIEKFVNALDTSELFIELRAHGTRNHGTAFRMYEKYFPNCYGTSETID